MMPKIKSVVIAANATRATVLGVCPATGTGTSVSRLVKPVTNESGVPAGSDNTMRGPNGPSTSERQAHRPPFRARSRATFHARAQFISQSIMANGTLTIKLKPCANNSAMAKQAARSDFNPCL
jgi:hypothetical protein